MAGPLDSKKMIDIVSKAIYLSHDIWFMWICLGWVGWGGNELTNELGFFINLPPSKSTYNN